MLGCGNRGKRANRLSETAQVIGGLWCIWVKVDEISRDCKRSALHELGRRGAQVVLGNCPDTQEDPREFVKPVWARKMSTECRLEVSVKVFDQTIGLWMVSRCVVQLVAQQLSAVRPQLRDELAAAVRGNVCGHSEAGDPARDKGSSNCHCCNVG
jgi:hypothetical protein